MAYNPKYNWLVVVTVILMILQILLLMATAFSQWTIHFPIIIMLVISSGWIIATSYEFSKQASLILDHWNINVKITHLFTAVIVIEIVLVVSILVCVAFCPHSDDKSENIISGKLDSDKSESIISDKSESIISRGHDSGKLENIISGKQMATHFSGTADTRKHFTGFTVGGIGKHFTNARLELHYYRQLLQEEIWKLVGLGKFSLFPNRKSYNIIFKPSKSRDEYQWTYNKLTNIKIDGGFVYFTDTTNTEYSVNPSGKKPMIMKGNRLRVSFPNDTTNHKIQQLYHKLVNFQN